MIYATYSFGEVTAIYYLKGDVCSLMLVPAGMEQDVKESKLALPDSL